MTFYSLKKIEIGIFKKIFFSVFVIYFISCEPVPRHHLKATNWPKSITYEIFIQSFADSNQDGIGDIQGLIHQLDYLTDLGIEAIWLMPVHPSPSYHKYDVQDYYGIHPDYGTLEDFRLLVKEAHGRGIKIILDLVINHCSSEHPWFLKAKDPRSTFRDFFVWSTLDEIEKEGTLTKEASGDSDNLTQWHSLPNQEELYFAFFYKGMPDLNYDNPRVRQEVYKIVKFWLEDIQVDGFRLDAAKHIFPDHRATDTHEFWKEFYREAKKIKSDVFTVGEVWADLPTQLPYSAGFSSLFNFDLAVSILESVKNEKITGATIQGPSWQLLPDSSPIDLIKTNQELFSTYNSQFVSATFLSNHDQNRVMSFLKGDSNKAKLAAAILLTLPGAPFIYYGEELGMAGQKPDEYIREPMPWGDLKATTTWINPKYSGQDTRESVAFQQNDSTSMLIHYKKWIKIRKSSPVLMFGKIEALFFHNEILAFTREYENEKWEIYHNLSGVEQHISGNFEVIEGYLSLTGNISPYQSIIVKRI